MIKTITKTCCKKLVKNFLGGAISNLYAMNAARHFHYPRVKPLGASDVPTLCAFTSEDVSFCLPKPSILYSSMKTYKTFA